LKIAKRKSKTAISSFMSRRASKFWKWVLIAAQVYFVAHQLALLFIPRARAFDGLPGLASIFGLAAWAFLLIGSPFFWRSHRWLACSGWCMAFGLFLFISFLARW
jgi:hypothetical protein